MANATMEIVGWSMSERLKSSLAVDAMRMARLEPAAAARADLSFRSGRPVCGR